jgi:hypothetical protein
LIFKRSVDELIARAVVVGAGEGEVGGRSPPPPPHETSPSTRPRDATFLLISDLHLS